MFKRVVTTGSLAFDHIMRMPGKFSDHILPDKIHILNVGFLVKEFNKEFGGTSINVAYTLSLLGVPSLVVASAGKDFSPYREYLDKFKKIDLSGVKIYENEICSQGFVITDSNNNQIWGYFKGAMDNNSSLKLGNYLKKTDFLVVGPNDGQAMIKFAKTALSLGVKYMFDPAFNIPHLSKEDLKSSIRSSTILIGNDYEIELIKRRLLWSQAKLLKNAAIVVTTLGPKGAIIETESEKILIPAARPLNESDPTGAGDAFRAGFLAGFVRGLPLEVCGKMGAVASVYTVEKYGTQTHHFTANEFARRFRTNYKEELPFLF